MVTLRVISAYADRLRDAPADIDVALLNAVSDGDEAALEQLWHRHAAAVHGYLRSICDAVLAEEVLLDTFTAVWKGAGSFSERSTARTWLFGIARRRARDRRRSLRTELDEPIPDQFADQAPSTEEQALARRELAEIAEAIKRLRPIHREVLALAFSQGLTHTEIAQVLDVPLGTVKSRMDSARRALMETVR